jgi:hypothetical protein
LQEGHGRDKQHKGEQKAVVLYLPKPGVLVLKIPTMAAAKTSITPSGI